MESDAAEDAAVTSEIEQQFLHFRSEIDSDQSRREEIRLVTRELERYGRDFVAALEKTHPLPSASAQHAGTGTRLGAVCANVRRQFGEVKQLYDKLALLAPSDQYYRYHDQFRWVTQRLAFAASLLIYLDSEQLASRQQVADLLGLRSDRGDGLHLDLEDYLHGLLQLASELARYSVNSVAAGDYGRPIKIHQFLTQLDAGFRLLNLKNDSLRKRFDALKYDVQKVENVVYDLTIRGLKPEPNAAAPAASAQA